MCQAERDEGMKYIDLFYDLKNIVKAIHFLRREDTFPANTESPNAVWILAHRLRRWPNIETALGDVLCLLGYGYQAYSLKAARRSWFQISFSRLRNFFQYTVFILINAHIQINAHPLILK